MGRGIRPHRVVDTVACRRNGEKMIVKRVLNVSEYLEGKSESEAAAFLQGLSLGWTNPGTVETFDPPQLDGGGQ